MRLRRDRIAVALEHKVGPGWGPPSLTFLLLRAAGARIERACRSGSNALAHTQVTAISRPERCTCAPCLTRPQVLVYSFACTFSPRNSTLQLHIGHPHALPFSLRPQVLVYNFADLRLLHTIETLSNPAGLLALSPSADQTVLACPGLHVGQVGGRRVLAYVYMCGGLGCPLFCCGLLACKGLGPSAGPNAIAIISRERFQPRGPGLEPSLPCLHRRRRLSVHSTSALSSLWSNTRQ